MKATRKGNPQWLVLWHQLPPKPAYVRVKIGRRLAALGAIALKNSVYALPSNQQTLEDLHWLRKEILAAGGDATVMECQFVEGLSGEQAVRNFNRARAAAFAAVEKAAGQALAGLRRKGNRRGAATLAGLRRALEQAIALDYLGAPGRVAAEARVAALESALLAPHNPESQRAVLKLADYQGRTWATRADVHSDRIASAWLIARHIDKRACFRFLPQGSEPKGAEIGFDMFEAPFTHDGDSCTFEVLLARFGLKSAPLVRLGESIHDIDLKDSKYCRPETPGLAAAMAGLAATVRNDEARLKAGFVLLDSFVSGLKGST